MTRPDLEGFSYDEELGLHVTDKGLLWDDKFDGVRERLGLWVREKDGLASGLSYLDALTFTRHLGLGLGTNRDFITHSNGTSPVLERDLMLGDVYDFELDEENVFVYLGVAGFDRDHGVFLDVDAHLVKPVVVRGAQAKILRGNNEVLTRRAFVKEYDENGIPTELMDSVDDGYEHDYFYVSPNRRKVAVRSRGTKVRPATLSVVRDLTDESDSMGIFAKELTRHRPDSGVGRGLFLRADLVLGSLERAIGEGVDSDNLVGAVEADLGLDLLELRRQEERGYVPSEQARLNPHYNDLIRFIREGKIGSAYELIRDHFEGGDVAHEQRMLRHLKAARRSENLGRHMDALAVYGMVLTMDDQNKAAYLGATRSSAKLHNYELATWYVDRAIELVDDSLPIEQQDGLLSLKKQEFYLIFLVLKLQELVGNVSKLNRGVVVERKRIQLQHIQ